MQLRFPALASHQLPTHREDLLKSLAQDHAAANGYVIAHTVRGDVLLLLREGRVWCAGIIEDEQPSGLPIQQALARLRSVKSAELRETDLPLFLCLAVLVRKAPSAHLPANLIDSEQILQSVRNTGKDAVLVVQRADARSLAFCREGEPSALYPALGEDFPAEGAVTDRIAEYLYAGPGPESVTLLLYDEIRLPPGKDAVHVTELAAFSDAPEPEADAPMVNVRLGGRLVFRYPVTQAETVVGRGEDADLALDNLSVSRRHLKIVRTPEGLFAEDLGSENGIEVDGERVQRAQLLPTQTVEVGKYTLELGDPDAQDDLSEPAVPISRAPGLSSEETIAIPRAPGRASLMVDGKRVPIKGAVLSIGSGNRAGLRIRGLLIADVHAVLRRGQEGFIAEHVGGMRRMRINGDPTKRSVLTDGDEIAIGAHRMVFKT